jgi:hypothetical protein
MVALSALLSGRRRSGGRLRQSAQLEQADSQTAYSPGEQPEQQQKEYIFKWAFLF